MKDFIERVLHQKISINKYKDTKNFPLLFIGNYNLYLLEICNQSCIIVVPVEDLGLAVIRKHHKRLQQLTGKECVLYFKDLSAYARGRMLDDGIPFIWEDHQIYMPFIGLWLKENDARELDKYEQISFLTQKLLLLALYECWDDMTVTMAAEKLQVSKMSITRAFDEIESLDIPIIYKDGRKRMLRSCQNKKEMWERIRGYLRSPLINEYYLKEDIGPQNVKSGISALCEYSILSDNDYPTYALTKAQVTEKKVKNKKQLPVDEQLGCVVQELGYVLCLNEKQLIDPLTVLLLMEKEMDDPRIEMAIDEMLEEYVW